MPGAGNGGVCDATIWVGESFSVRTAGTPRHHPPGLRAADAVRILVQLRGHDASDYDIGPADGALFAFRVDRSGPLMCALNARGLADEIIADISRVPAPGGAR
jgi:hypothetical protein